MRRNRTKDADLSSVASPSGPASDDHARTLVGVTVVFFVLAIAKPWDFGSSEPPAMTPAPVVQANSPTPVAQTDQSALGPAASSKASTIRSSGPCWKAFAIAARDSIGPHPFG